MQNQLGDIRKAQGQEGHDLENFLNQVDPPFTDEIMEEKVPHKFKLPVIKTYDGSKDPIEHLDTYRSWMELHGVRDAIKCRAFSFTLTGPARKWFRQLKRKLITSFWELACAFITQFLGGRDQRKSPSHLLTVKQGRSETLRESVSRFNNKVLHIEGYTDGAAFTTIVAGLRHERFLLSLGKKAASSYVELLSRAQRYISAKELLRSRVGQEIWNGRSELEVARARRDEAQQENRKRKFNEKATSPIRGNRRGLPTSKFERYTSTVAPVEQILMEVQDKELLKWPAKLKAGVHRTNKDKYYLFHKDHGHTTADCFDLKEAIEALIRRGQLKEYAGRKEEDYHPNRDPRNRFQTPPRKIRTIFGGFAGGESWRKRKAHTREARHSPTIWEICSTRVTRKPISFTTEDIASLYQPHNDAMVVALTIANNKVHRILMDGGSSADVLSLRAFDEMAFGRSLLKSRQDPLIGLEEVRSTPREA